MPEYIEREAAIEAVRHAWAKGLEPSQYIEVIQAADVAPLALLEKWLYEIAFNNLGTGSQKDTAFAESCEEIINRLDGLRAFIRDETNN